MALSRKTNSSNIFICTEYNTKKTNSVVYPGVLSSHPRLNLEQTGPDHESAIIHNAITTFENNFGNILD